MKKFLKNIKYLAFTFALLVVSFAVSHSAQASQYTYTCSDGGTITSTVNMSPSGPFSSGNPTTFTASGQITSTCGTRTINLTTQNNSGTVITLIPNTTIGPGTFPALTPATTSFTSPSPAGTYAVHFITGVDEILPPVQNYFFGNQGPFNDGAVHDVCTIGDLTPWYGARDTDTEQDAAARGISHVVVTYQIPVDNDRSSYPACIRYGTADFYPGDLEVPITWSDGSSYHDFTCGHPRDYCAGLASDNGGPGVSNIHEY